MIPQHRRGARKRPKMIDADRTRWLARNRGISRIAGESPPNRKQLLEQYGRQPIHTAHSLPALNFSKPTLERLRPAKLP